MFFILMIFILQFLGLRILIGSLSGSVFLLKINLIDPFAFLEVLLASKSLTISLATSLIPVIIIYLVFGRAFCGWLCPFDFLFKLIDKFSPYAKRRLIYLKENGLNKKRSVILGWILLVIFIILAIVIELPVFTRYISHNTNLFRAISSLIGIIKGMSYVLDEFIFSISILGLFFTFEFFFPRQWCKNFCPSGKMYGLFNKMSLIRLKFENLKACKECFACQVKCYMDVPLNKFIVEAKDKSNKSSGRFINCIYCGECVLSCEKIQRENFNIKISLLK